MVLRHGSQSAETVRWMGFEKGTASVVPLETEQRTRLRLEVRELTMPKL